MSKKKTTSATEPLKTIHSEWPVPKCRDWGEVALTAKQWRQLSGWVRENSDLCDGAQAFDLVAIAKHAPAKFPEYLENDGWSACAVGRSYITTETIREAARLAGVELAE